jgi:hypothetical protein
VVEEYEILNNVVHRDLRIRAEPGAIRRNFVVTMITEFPAAASSCPIFFAKSPETGEFYAGALFGFESGEVLVEGAAEGRAMFQPLDIQRDGFMIAEDNIAIDPAHPRFGAGATIALFEDDGSPSNALKKFQRMLGQIHAGLEATRDFLREMLRLKLIEPVDVSLQFDDGKNLTLDGLYTISRDALRELDDASVLSLFRSGYLQAAMSVTLSLNQVAVLARRRNDRLTA